MDEIVNIRTEAGFRFEAYLPPLAGFNAQYDGAGIPYYYVNIDHTNDIMRNSFSIYDKDHIRGLPMFSIVTLGYDKGIIKPYYTTLYGTLNLDNDSDRLNYLIELLQQSTEIYSQNSEGYNP